MTATVFAYAAPFPLADQLVTAAGRRLCTGHRARVVHLLAITRRDHFEHALGGRRSPAGWVPEFLLQQPWSGGGEGKRRLREAREMYGIEYDHEVFTPPSGESTTVIYRLTSLGEVGGYTALPTAAKPADLRLRFSTDAGASLLDVPRECVTADHYQAHLRELWAAGRLEPQILCRQNFRLPVADSFDPLGPLRRMAEALGLTIEVDR